MARNIPACVNGSQHVCRMQQDRLQTLVERVAEQAGCDDEDKREARRILLQCGVKVRKALVVALPS